jgi:hypothetical protein
MKHYLLGLLCMLAVVVALAQGIPQPSGKTIHPGEVLTYKVTYGIFPVGEAKIETSPSVHQLNNTPCYKVDITGKTTGAVGLVARVDDKWGAYLNAHTLLPVKSYRIVRENNYKRDEMSFFDHANKNIRYQRYDHKAARFQEPVYFDFEGTVRDLVGGYQHLRQLDYSQILIGDTIALPGFFEDEFYNFKILFQGRETIKTQFGKVQALKLVPVMPNNKVFDGENSITLWFSDDENKIPLKIEANMFVGKAGCEIVSHQNLKSPLLVSRK